MGKGKYSDNLTPPILGGLLGKKSGKIYDEGNGTKKGYGDSKRAAKRDFDKKNRR